MARGAARGGTPEQVLEWEIAALAKQLAARGSRDKAGVFSLGGLGERLVASAMANDAFKTQLFRFVDVFPSLTDDAAVLAHVEEYFDGEGVPRLLETSVSVADHLPGGGRLTARIARSQITKMAEQFIIGTTAADAATGLHALWKQGRGFVVDLLGEKTVTEAEADRYAARSDELIRSLLDTTIRWRTNKRLDYDDLGPLPRVAVALKPTALASLYAPLTREDGLEQAKSRLRPILRLAAERGALVWFDMERAEVKDLTLELFCDLLSEPEFSGPPFGSRLHAGIAIQAYLKDAASDLTALIAWARARAAAAAAPAVALIPISVRLVKGAYWDAETIQAEAEGWPVPVFSDKADTDASFEACSRILLEAHGVVRPAFATHNVRSLAHAVAYARSLDIPDDGIEVQMLNGMAEPLQDAVVAAGLRLRVYAPVGDLVPGMAYLVRRLLENTSNEGFVRRSYAEGVALDELIRRPVPTGSGARLPTVDGVAVRRLTDPARPGGYEPEPMAEWRRSSVREAFGAAVKATADEVVTPIEVPASIGGVVVRTAETIESVDPADRGSVVARSAACGIAEADAAVAGALAAWPAWRSLPALARAGVLFHAAEWMRRRRGALAALEVFEAGKPWAEADADVCEAVDFLEYYGRAAIRLADGAPVLSPPGERNVCSYIPRGVVAAITPWNFPLAIPTGMVAAALVTGNPVVLKPAEQTPATAWRLVEALQHGLTEMGAPLGVLGFVPGRGEIVGARLVEHPDVAAITFTGSRDVGLGIVAAAAVHGPGQRYVKRVVAEMGGKNALVVDADADLDAAVGVIVGSAFGFAGQKCSALSRLVVVDSIHDELVLRVAGAAKELRLGHPRDPRVQLGPVIDGDAHARCVLACGRAAEDGRLALGGVGSPVPAKGWFVPATIATDLTPGSRLLADEIFGPLLCVQRARDFEHAVELANGTDSALTAGVLSRSPRHIAFARDALVAGNVYVNRGITGAVVGRQPFGGGGLSGVGSKTGGPDSLLPFVEQRVVTENTVRQGFAPD